MRSESEARLCSQQSVAVVAGREAATAAGLREGDFVPERRRRAALVSHMAVAPGRRRVTLDDGAA
jgi:hypothetical protein